MKYGRSILAGVEGYVPGEQPRSSGVIKLNTNENPYPPSPQVLDALWSLTTENVRKYPDPVSRLLRQACAERYGYPGAEWVIAGNGMDELLALAVRTFVDPGDAVLSPYPTYTLYETLSALHGARFMGVDLDDSFQLTPAFFEAKARLCFLPRPNAPSGVAAPRAEVERFCRGFDGIVVIDEAYVDFADDTCMDFPRVLDNVIVMRTFSKAFSLAGMRLGIAVAQPAIIEEFMKCKDSYNINMATQAAGLAAIQDYDYMLGNGAKIRATRTRLTRALTDYGFDVPRSQANFVLAQWDKEPSAKAIFDALKDQSIFVRYFAARRLENCLRITVGTESEVDALLDTLREIIYGVEKTPATE
ncbi:MAG: histidinol-phosphate transaminase [Candidatus Hydrogenedentes bacterium]|nr:histidinol-phosphate transaminase [Candidatus Hydrogenedentota bacterium]